MATIKHLTSKNSNYAAAESYLTFQHNEYTGLPILDEKGRPKLRDSYLLDTLECGESSFAMACLIANRKYGKNGRREDVKTHHIWRHPPKRMLIYSCAARTAGHTKYIISFDPKDAVENGLTQNSKILPGDALTVVREEETLEVRITKVESWEEEIAYTTETTKSKELNSGTKRVTQKGENGIRTVTAQRVYDANGNQLSQQILSTVVTKEPVTEKVTVGTKKVSSGASYITGRGQFIWPVPGYRNCSRWYGGSHKGVDICAAAGTPIYASAGGTVTKAGYNRAGAGNGYGNSIIISHGNGYTTVYAHCLSLVVHAGQSVKQGQLIGYVGSTGRSSGNHCHFEIRRNGSYIAPQNVFNRSKYR